MQTDSLARRFLLLAQGTGHTTLPSISTKFICLLKKVAGHPLSHPA